MITRRVGGLELIGFSLAGEETVIAVPELNLCFDVGRAPREIISIDNVCLSHGHMDHAAGIAYYFSQRNFLGNAPGRLLLHEALADPVRRLMEVWAEIERHPSPGKMIPLRHLEEVELRRNLFVRAFDVNHGACALGFTAMERRHKLRPEFADRTGPQLVALKKEGVKIEYPLEKPLITCTGDTALGPFLDLPFVRESELVLIECTFFERDHRSRARAGRHMHVEDLPAVFDAIPNAHVVLTHTTRRTDLRAARKTLARIVAPRDLERITFLMERPPREPARTSPV